MKDLSFTVPPEYSGAQVKTFLRRGCGRIGKAAVAMQEMRKRDSKKWEACLGGGYGGSRGHGAPDASPGAQFHGAGGSAGICAVEDDALLILNKPPQMPVHPCPGHDRGTVCNFVSYYQKGRVKIGGSAL